MKALLVLDFDGVICDSVDECFASSWEARHRMGGGPGFPDPPPGRDRAFAGLRPFVRTGEDFYVILTILEQGIEVADQAGFDTVAKALPPLALAEFKRRFYEARERLLAEERERWLSLNRIYPHMREALVALGAAPLRILSTKKAPYISEILAANGLHLPGENVCYQPSGPKVPVVREMLERSGLDRAVFIDDQIDYLLGAGQGIEVYLASWGYVRPEWLASPPRVPLIDPDRMLALARGLAV